MYLDENACRFYAQRDTLTFVSPYFGTVVRLSPWKQPCRIMLQNSVWGDGLLEEDFPLFTTDVLQHMPEHPISRYAATLPPEVVAGLVNYEVDQLSMLQVCAASPRGVQLLHSAPNLLWLVAPDMVRKGNGAPDQIHEMLGHKQMYLLRLMEYAPGAVVLKLLAQASPPQIMDNARARLLCMMQNPACCDIVRHRKNTSWEMLGVMERYDALLGIPVIRKASLKATRYWHLFDELKPFLSLYTDTLRLGQALNIGDAQVCALRCRSIRELRVLHDRWTERLNAAHDEMRMQALADLCFPEPPLPASNSIQPLRNGAELFIEGKTMHHCVGSYIHSVCSGEVYIYRVLAPERATLELCHKGDGQWNIRQLKGYCNKSVNMGCRQAVHAWLWAAQERRSAKMAMVQQSDAMHCLCKGA